jgi:predicted porin
MKYEETGGTVGKFQDYKHNSWAVGAEHRIGAMTLVGTYGQASAGSCTIVGGAVCNTSGLDGKMLNLGVGYDLSKRTLLYAVYSRMDNGASAVYSNFANGKPDSGQDINTFALGISHSF